MSHPIRQQFDSVDAHEPAQRIVPPLEIRLAVFEFHGGELAPQDLDQEVAAAAVRFQEAGIDTIGLRLHEVQHCLYQPRRSEDLPVVGDALFLSDEAHGSGDVSNSIAAAGAMIWNRICPPRSSRSLSPVTSQCAAPTAARSRKI